MCLGPRDISNELLAPPGVFSVANAGLRFVPFCPLVMLSQRLVVQITKFRKYWPGPMYWDSTKAFYRVLGNGQLAKGKVLPLLNPFSKVITRSLFHCVCLHYAVIHAQCDTPGL